MNVNGRKSIEAFSRISKQICLVVEQQRVDLMPYWMCNMISVVKPVSPRLKGEERPLAARGATLLKARLAYTLARSGQLFRSLIVIAVSPCHNNAPQSIANYCTTPVPSLAMPQFVAIQYTPFNFDRYFGVKFPNYNQNLNGLLKTAPLT